MTSQPGMTLWSVRANIVQERPYGPLGLDQKPGTRHFRGGTKVWAIDAFRGMADSVVVVGPHRGSARYVKMVVHISALDQLRTAIIYSPAVIRMVSEHYGSVPYPFDGDSAREFARMLTGWRTAQEPEAMRALFRVIGPREGDVLRLQQLSAYPDPWPLLTYRSASWPLCSERPERRSRMSAAPRAKSRSANRTTCPSAGKPTSAKSGAHPSEQEEDLVRVAEVVRRWHVRSSHAPRCPSR